MFSEKVRWNPLHHPPLHTHILSNETSESDSGACGLRRGPHAPRRGEHGLYCALAHGPCHDECICSLILSPWVSAGQWINLAPAGPDYHPHQRHFCTRNFPIQNRISKNTIPPPVRSLCAFPSSHSRPPLELPPLKGCKSPFETMLLKSAVQLAIWDLHEAGVGRPLCACLSTPRGPVMTHTLTSGLTGDIYCSYLRQGLVGDKQKCMPGGLSNSPSLLPLHLPPSRRGPCCCLRPEGEHRRDMLAQDCRTGVRWPGSWPPSRSFREERTRRHSASLLRDALREWEPVSSQVLPWDKYGASLIAGVQGCQSPSVMGSQKWAEFLREMVSRFPNPSGSSARRQILALP